MVGKREGFGGMEHTAISGRHNSVIPIGEDQGEESKVTGKEDEGCPVTCKSGNVRLAQGEVPERVV